MAVSAKWYGQAFLRAFTKDIGFLADTIKVMLVTSAYTPDQDGHIFKSSITNEVVGTGYTAGGVTLANKTLGYTGATNVLKFDADDISWANSTITARYAVIYDDTPATDAAKPLLGYIDFGEDKISTTGLFPIAWDAAGIFTVTPA